MNYNSTFLPMDRPTFYASSSLSPEIIAWISAYPAVGECWLGGSGVYFEFEEDRTMFVLKWA